MTRKQGERRAKARQRLGRRLRVLRVGLGMSNKAVCAVLKISPQTLISWEQGKYELSGLDSLRLADLYQVTIATLYGRKNDQIGPSDPEEAAELTAGEADESEEVAELAGDESEEDT